MIAKSLALAAACAALVGCAQSVVSAPRVPVPVLLGPIDRVGGHRGDGEVVTPLQVEIGDFVSVSRSQERVGNQVVTTTTTKALRDGAGLLSVKILNATNAQHDNDVRISRLGTGAWVWISPDLASLQRNEWIDVEASVTKERAR